jgi:hypothetical protein
MFVLGSFYPHYAYLKILLSLLRALCQHILLSPLCISEDLVILTTALLSTDPVILTMHIWRSCYPYYCFIVNRSCYPHYAYLKILLSLLLLYCKQILLSSVCISEDLVIFTKCFINRSFYPHYAYLGSCYPYYVLYVNTSCYPHYAYLKILLTLLRASCHHILFSTPCISAYLVILTMCFMSKHSIILTMHIWRSC